MKICVIFNPAAKGEKARRLHHHLEAVRHECTLLETTAAGSGRQLAAEAFASGHDVIVAAGGDGTLNEILNGLAPIHGALDRTRIGLLPLGTANVAAWELGIPRHPARAWRILRQGFERRLDLPRLEWQGDGRPKITRHFLQLAGVGLDARAVERVDLGLKRRYGALAYVWAAWQAFREAPRPFVVRHGRQSHPAALALIGNGRFYGGPMPFHPAARYDDGVLDVCLFERVNWLTLGRLFFTMATWSWSELPGVTRLQGRSFEFRPASEATPVEVDGDEAGHLPMKLSLDPGRVRFLAPEPPRF